VIDLAALRIAQVAVVGLEVTTGCPPLIVELAVYHVDGGSVTARPWCFCVAADAPPAEVRVSAWPKLRLAPPWVEVAERVKVAVADRVVTVHDHSRWDVLQRNLPGWQPAGVVRTPELAEQAWPDLSDYSLGHPGDLEPGRGGGALREAHRVTLLLDALVHLPGTGSAAGVA
jgi:exodeoxyribonuclease X